MRPPATESRRSTPHEANTGRGRLVEVDALRGLAAIAVVLYHFTTRFGEIYRDNPSASASFPEGYYGVNLFFIISGFVIFMTLERTKQPMDFVVSRFSRLFPAYWFAIFLTFSITHLLGLPGKLVSIDSALANMIMVHGLFWVPAVLGTRKHRLVNHVEAACSQCVHGCSNYRHLGNHSPAGYCGDALGRATGNALDSEKL